MHTGIQYNNCESHWTGGPYAAFAGHDATRALATFSVKDVKDCYDDLSDLSSMQMDSVREWEMQFTGEACCIGCVYVYDFLLFLFCIAFLPFSI